MQSYPIKKSFFQHTQHTKISNLYRTKANKQLQISSATTYCELAVKQLFFEKPQSCVSTTATLSHRFKSSPAISVSPAVFAITGYLMLVGHFSESPESNGDLNRGRRTESRVLFDSFCTTQKECKNVPFAGNSEVLQTSIQHTAVTSSHRNN